MKKISGELINKVVDLRQEGLSFDDIAELLGIGKGAATHASRLGGGTKKRLSSSLKKEIQEKRLQGEKLESLALFYGVSKTTIIDICSGLDLSHLKTNADIVVAEYQTGSTVKELAERFGLKERSIASILYRRGVSKRSFVGSKRKDLISDRQKGMSRTELAAKYCLTEHGVKNILSRGKVSIDPSLAQKNIVAGRKQGFLDSKGVTNHNELMAKYAKSHNGQFAGSYAGTLDPVEWVCERGHSFVMRPNSVQQGQWCPRCAFVGPSTGQVEIGEYMKSLGFEVEVGNRNLVVNPKTGRNLELDLYVKEKNFAIEYNGLHWHSEKYTSPGRHYTKAMGCRAAGIALLAIFEDEWTDKTELIKGMIRHRLGILGIKTRASSLTLRKLVANSEYKSFFERNHLDGHSPASFAYGLFDGDKLISCMSFRTNFNKELEIARFATDYDYHIYGGAGRLIKAVKKDGIGALTTFSNNRLSEGNVYRVLGFSLVKENKSSYWYTDGKTRIWRFRCRRVNSPEILALYPEVKHTERAQAEGGVFSMAIFGDRRPLTKIEDYGHRKWVLNP